MGKATVPFGQLFQQIHQLGEAGSLFRFVCPAQKQNILENERTDEPNIFQKLKISIKIPKGKELEVIIPSHFRYCLEVRRKAKLNEIKRKLALQARQ